MRRYLILQELSVSSEASMTILLFPKVGALLECQFCSNKRSDGRHPRRRELSILKTR